MMTELASEAVHTALYDCQKEMGAAFMEWGGWMWTASFGDPLAEYHAVRERVGLVDGSPLRKWEFRGRDAGRALDRIVTQECLTMVDGQVHYSAMCNEDGTMRDDVTVFRFDAEHFRLIAMMDSDEEHCRRHTTDLDVEISPSTSEVSNMQLQGPRSREAIEAAGADVEGLAYFRFRTAAIAGCECVISRTGYSGELGYEVFCPAADAAQVWRALLAAGSDYGIRPYGMEAVDFLRIESALLIVDAEYQPGRHTPYAINLGWTVKLGKEDFIGRRALVEASQTTPEEQLVGLEFPDGDPPEDGADVTAAGEVVGGVTVARRSPTLERAVGLALLRTDAIQASALQAGDRRARVAPLPFYDPQKRRPRS